MFVVEGINLNMSTMVVIVVAVPHNCTTLASHLFDCV
jgi:hypothetical protein